MRPLPRSFTILFLAAFLCLGLRVALEAATFGYKFHWPPGWYAEKGSSYDAVPSSPGVVGDPPSVRVRGWIQQQASLVNGLRRPLRISFRYRAPQGGAWCGVVGDAGSFTELRLQAQGDLPVPAHPDSGGLYRVALPPSSTWKPISLRVVELTDLPRITLCLGGPTRGGDVRFAAARMNYDNAPQDALLENGRFVDQWPLWIVFPEWITPDGPGGWAPVRFLTLVALFSSLLLVIHLRRKGDGFSAGLPERTLPDGRHNAITRRQSSSSRGRKSRETPQLSLQLPKLTWGTFLAWAAWLGLSSLLVMTSGELTELGQIWVGSDLSPQRLGAVTDFVWLLQLGLFFFVGWAGFGLVGRVARFWTPLIPVLAALAMSPGIGVIMPNGTPTPLVNFTQFTEGLGPIWVLTGIIAAWSGVLWADAQAKR